MNYKLLSLFVLCIFSVSFASAWSTNVFNNSLGSQNVTLIPAGNCYQEFANVSNACGGFSNGTYTQDGLTITNFANATDGNYSTFMLILGLGKSLYINYTAPIGAVINGSSWQIRAAADATFNQSLETCSIAGGKLQLRVYVEQVGSPFENAFQCWTGSAWNTLYTSFDAGGSQYRLYEEAVMWSIPAVRYLSVPASVNFLTNAYINVTGFPYYCYQESANVSTTCGGLNTGRYQIGGNGTWDDGGRASIDGDFDTASLATTETAIVYINYSKPSFSTASTLWRVAYSKDEDFPNIVDRNLSIPSSCWNADSAKLMLRFVSVESLRDISYECYNNTNQWQLVSYNSSVTNLNVIEEGIQWAIFPNNVTVTLDSYLVFNHTGVLNATNRTNNFATTVNSYLASCVRVAGVCYVPLSFTSGTFGVIQYASLLFSNEGIINNSASYNTTSYESAYETFIQNISYDSASYSLAAYLIYNGTSYTVPQIGSGNTLLFSKALDIPLVTAPVVKNVYWSFALTNATSTIYYNTTTQTQGVGQINFTLCGAAPQNNPYINFTFKNETAGQETTRASIISSWTYWLGSGSVTESYTLTNASENPSYAFCFTPANRTLQVIPSVQYANSVSVTRNYAPGTISLSNQTSNTVLFLLPTVDGIYVTFQVVSGSLLPLSGVNVNITSATFGGIESKTTSDAGAVTFFLNPNTAYTLCASKTGYSTYCTTDTFTESSYTIQLGTLNISSNNDYNRGIAYSILPTVGQLNNNTNYNFQLNLTSSYWSLTSFGFYLTNGTDIFSSASSTDSAGGSASVTMNTGTNKTITMNGWWLTNGTYSNFSVTWIVIDEGDTSFSLMQFFTRLSTYLSAPNDSDGLFGLKAEQGQNFGLAIILFVIIFSFAGIMSYKYGLTSSGAVTFILFTGVLFFDVGLNLLPNPVDAAPHFPTVIMAVILFIMLGREALR